MAQSTADKKQEPKQIDQQVTHTLGVLMREPSEAERASMQLYGQWFQELITFLLTHQQPYAQAIGLQQTNSILQSQSTQIDSDSLQAFYQSHGLNGYHFSAAITLLREWGYLSCNF